MTDRVEATELRQEVEAIERLEAEKADTAELIKERYAGLKSRGYDAAIVRKVIARRKRDRDDLAEEAAILELYEGALS
ncbi:DUF2312 domain-containing protein [Rhodobacteraceae bacterium R_SAG2]|nr:DUF2312 domain-containing protein [Rhodobacteraceae bacterium R_SAG2]